MIVLLSVYLGTNGYASTSSVTKHTSVILTQDSESTEVLSEEEKSLAKQWMLKDTDWVKYKRIMEGPRGTWSPGLDPLTALGVMETDQEERERYAEIWIKVETRRSELEIAFEVERRAAGKRIHKNQSIVNNVAWKKEWQEKRTEIKKIVNLFIDVSCMEECFIFYSGLRSSISHNSRMDIYFNEGASSEDIGIWARFMKIDTSEVSARKITLNLYGGEEEEMDVDSQSLPQVRVLDIATGKITKTNN